MRRGAEGYFTLNNRHNGEKQMKRNAIDIEDAVLLDNKLWFLLSDYKCLVAMDIETKETKTYTIPSSGSYTQARSYGSMALVGRRIYLIPLCDRMLFQFDVDSEEFEEIKIDSEVIENKTILFMAIGVYHKYLFVMGISVPAVLRVNTENNHIDYITDWKFTVEKQIFDSKDAYFRKQSVVIEDKLYVPFCNANAVLEIDCNTLKTVIHSMGGEKQGYSGICFDGESLWLSPRKNGSIKKWNLHINQVDAISIFGLEELGDTLTYVGIVLNRDKKILLPNMNKQDMTIEVDDVEVLKGSYVVAQDDKENTIFYERNSGIFTVIDRVSMTQTEIEIEKVDVDIEKILSESNNFTIENSAFTIWDFIRGVC